LGIIAIPLGFSVVIGIILGILAVILGWLGKKKADTDPMVGGRGMAIAGIVLGIIAVVIAILLITLLATLFTTVFSMPFLTTY